VPTNGSASFTSCSFLRLCLELHELCYRVHSLGGSKLRGTFYARGLPLGRFFSPLIAPNCTGSNEQLVVPNLPGIADLRFHPRGPFRMGGFQFPPVAPRRTASSSSACCFRTFLGSGGTNIALKLTSTSRSIQSCVLFRQAGVTPASRYSLRNSLRPWARTKAESLRRTPDRLDPQGLPGPFHLQRAASKTNLEFLFHLLLRIEDSFRTRQAMSTCAAGLECRKDHQDSAPRRPASPL
jgi:hypothetical protein